MKSHYELLGVPPSADLETIKKAFRREIARYHPDKVMHLGPEFQDMAAARAAELTAAYKTLSDPELREAYDQLAPAAPGPPPSAAPAPAPVPAPPPEPEAEAPNPAAARMFERERAGRDSIVRRAVLARVRERVERLVGEVDVPEARGFDLALVPRARTRFLARPQPRVLVRLETSVDGPLAADLMAAAGRTRIGDPKAPLVVLLFASAFAPRQEIARALEDRRRAAGEGPSVVLVDIRDWSVRLLADAPAGVRKLAEALSGS
ncbi:MAG: DnaJ domain-containing protein [Vicinamibacterales bacterium]